MHNGSSVYVYDTGNPKAALSDNLEGGMGERWEGVQEGMDLCIPSADSYWCTAKAITIL